MKVVRALGFAPLSISCSCGSVSTHRIYQPQSRTRQIEGHRVQRFVAARHSMCRRRCQFERGEESKIKGGEGHEEVLQ